MKQYVDKQPFDSSSMVHFRKRIGGDMINKANELVAQEYREIMRKKTEQGKKDAEEAQLLNSGKLLIDATCTPADIRYPNDISLLNESRENAERIIDYLYTTYRKYFSKKPRTYRKCAHKDYISYTKKRKPRATVRNQAKRKQLNYLKRDIGIILSMTKVIEQSESFEGLPKKHARKLKTIEKIFEQQQEMYLEKKNRVENRIVSVSQPHIRPIVRGKAGKSVEFGAKISLSVCDGISYIDRLSWDNYNESVDLKDQVEKYRERYGYYPESVHADKIYQTRENKLYCKERNIRMTGKPLGRPRKVTIKNADEIKKEELQRYQDDVDRIPVEGRFGVAKRKYGMGLIKTKLQETSELSIHMSVLVMNLDKIASEEIKDRKNRYKILKSGAA